MPLAGGARGDARGQRLWPQRGPGWRPARQELSLRGSHDRPEVPADPRGGAPGESPLPGGVQHPSALPRGPRAARAFACLPDPALAGFPWGRCAPWGVPGVGSGLGAV